MVSTCCYKEIEQGHLPPGMSTIRASHATASGSDISMLYMDRPTENLRSVFVDQYYDKVGEVFPERKTNTHNNYDGNTKDAVRGTASFSDLMLVLYMPHLVITPVSATSRISLG